MLLNKLIIIVIIINKKIKLKNRNNYNSIHVINTGMGAILVHMLTSISYPCLYNTTIYIYIITFKIIVWEISCNIFLQKFSTCVFIYVLLEIQVLVYFM